MFVPDVCLFVGLPACLPVLQKETAAHKAGRSGNLSILDILRKAGADMDALNAEVSQLVRQSSWRLLSAEA